MKTGSIKQRVKISATPKAIYELLMDSKKHSAFTGSKAAISSKVGGNYTAYDGYITGKNIELIPGKKIVQTWRAVDGKWPVEHYSEITFTLTADGKGTSLLFTQKNIPIDQVAEFKKGWKDFYWNPMKIYFSNK